MILGTILDLYSLVIAGAVIVSWIELPPNHPVVQLVRAFTAPALRPIRRMLPSMGGLDLSPMVRLIGLQFLRLLFVL